MKYQKLENQEANWKWIYLIRKHREGEKITRYEEKSLEESKVQELIECQNYPEKIEDIAVGLACVQNAVGTGKGLD